MAEHNETGEMGEDVAYEYLIKEGYNILERNWRFGRAEIDIIAMDKNEIVFIEVKTRSSRYLVEPEIAVNRTKQKLITSAADKYVTIKKIDAWGRFDIVSIVVHPQGKEIRHIKGAYTA
jgi:putative endonuclease